VAKRSPISATAEVCHKNWHKNSTNVLGGLLRLDPLEELTTERESALGEKDIKKELIKSEIVNVNSFTTTSSTILNNLCSVPRKLQN